MRVLTEAPEEPVGALNVQKRLQHENYRNDQEHVYWTILEFNQEHLMNIVENLIHSDYFLTLS